MAKLTRLSMNTSLKDARIFDDICDDAMDAVIKQTTTKTTSPENQEFQELSVKIKVEPGTATEPELNFATVKQEKFATARLKLKEIGELENKKVAPQVKKEVDHFWNIKREVVEEDSIQEVQQEVLLKCASIKRELPDLDELSNSYSSPIKKAKKSVLARVSPYQKPTAESSRATERVGQCVRNLSLRSSRTPVEQETDPIVLARRQKQIDYGKNTIGYDNYIRAVPRYKRTRNDPGTPDKYKQYSRRGFDSLIKTWRLRLHNYD